MNRTIVFLVTVIAAATAMAATPIGIVVGIEGEVTAVDTKGATRSLSLKDDIFLNDTIRTGAGARLQVMFNDDSLYAQGENSEMFIDEYVFDPSKKRDNRFGVRLGKGLFRVITGKITDLNPEMFKVKTGRATIGIRGCELGFLNDADSDQIYIVRIPAGRNIFIESLSGNSMTIRDSGVLIDVRDDGRLQRGSLGGATFRSLLGGTSPRRKSGSKNDSDEESRKGRREQEQNPSWNNETDAIVGQIGTTTTEAEGMSSSALEGTDNPALSTDVELIVSSQIDSANDTIPDALAPTTTEPTGTLTPQPRDESIDPNAPSLKFSGKGIGASYLDAGGGVFRINRAFMFDKVEGGFQDNIAAVSLSGRGVGANGIPLGDVFQDVSLALPADSAGLTTPFQERMEDSLLIAGDSKQQFVRVVDLSGVQLKMYYCGYETESFGVGKVLSPGSVYEYDAYRLRYHTEITSPSMNMHENVPVYVNTLTDSFYIPASTMGGPRWGPLSALTFYGEDAQGIGGMREPLFRDTTMIEGPEIFAGFLKPGRLDAETEKCEYMGYASACAYPVSSPGMSRFYSSASMSGDSLPENEGAFKLLLDKAVSDNNVLIDGRLSADHSLGPQPSDIHLGIPDHSFYVMGDEFAAEYTREGFQASVVAVGGGSDWEWGVWNAERDTDYGSGPVKEVVHGQFVVGQVINPADFQNLVSGSTLYELRTPSDAMGIARAIAGDGTFHKFMEGTAMLEVSVGNGNASWLGNFSLQNLDGDNLFFFVTSQPISTEGRLISSSVDSLSMQVQGTAYGTPTTARMTGNLVGPGIGTTPITGAIGNGQLEWTDGMNVSITYGTDLR